ncbi:hypothetical protein M378DRAFT_171378 [Amanita muscaria Koide BX008]|uniref:Uncharacterized protein n=1 Tax=Amanita muscaria (strain Koide BX008) TaxID=946122 RepID=A0A0C2W9A5_AMAMK|nr:hypothetical protein M378DRAFT_172375 [Amanita muscaria Koide BX008]KIL57787.1 hypothetical protein M378DRAFT_171378 [Amanita muscaria Koide BX008]
MTGRGDHCNRLFLSDTYAQSLTAQQAESFGDLSYVLSAGREDRGIRFNGEMKSANASGRRENTFVVFQPFVEDLSKSWIWRWVAWT